jgi:hypothetical protein
VILSRASRLVSRVGVNRTSGTKQSRNQRDHGRSGAVKATTLRQSVLKKAFSGQLVPPDPNDETASVLLDRTIRAERAQVGSSRQKNKKNVQEHGTQQPARTWRRTDDED